MFLSISGNIGVGKTTLAKLISKEMDFKLYEEKVDNSILDKFYKDIENNVKPSDHAFYLQKYFLFTRAAAHMDMQFSDENSIQDRSIYEDRYVFANHLNNSGFISDEHYDEYLSNYAIGYGGLKEPDLLIHLKASPKVLRERIAKRGRESEKQLLYSDNPYLEELDSLYSKMISNYSGKTLIINSENYDLANNSDDKEKILSLVKNNLGLNSG